MQQDNGDNDQPKLSQRLGGQIPERGRLSEQRLGKPSKNITE
jgi:hypothetical protein